MNFCQQVTYLIKGHYRLEIFNFNEFINTILSLMCTEISFD